MALELKELAVVGNMVYKMGASKALAAGTPVGVEAKVPCEIEGAMVTPLDVEILTGVVPASIAAVMVPVELGMTG